MFSKRSWFLVLCLIVALSLISCSNGEPAELQFDYELSQETYQPELEQALQLKIRADAVEFVVKFQGGSGAYDKARLDFSDNIINVVLFDVDGVQQKMFVLFQFSGTVSGLSPGKYNIRIIDVAGNVIQEETFHIQ